MLYKNLDLRKKKVREFIRNNPKTTRREIKRNLHMKIEKIYSGGMGEAFKDAGIKPPRNFKKKTAEEKRKIIIEYIKKNPKAGGHLIRKDTKINFSILFKSVRDAFEEAGVEYPREALKKPLKQRRKEIINAVRENPLITIAEIRKMLKIEPYKIFKDIKEIYKKAGIEEIGRGEKRRIKKMAKIISFIRDNRLATQREINQNCNTKVQEIFKNGIFEAYEKAGIKFPYERLHLYGTSLKEVKQRAKNFEDEIAVKLSGYGKVNRLVKTKRGFADIILERNNKKAIIEVKDYVNKEIAISQIKQLNKYLEDCSCNFGILICRKKPQKDRFLMGKNKITLLEDSELSKIPELFKGL